MEHLTSATGIGHSEFEVDQLGTSLERLGWAMPRATAAAALLADMSRLAGALHSRLCAYGVEGLEYAARAFADPLPEASLVPADAAHQVWLPCSLTAPELVAAPAPVAKLANPHAMPEVVAAGAAPWSSFDLSSPIAEKVKDKRSTPHSVTSDSQKPRESSEHILQVRSKVPGPVFWTSAPRLLIFYVYVFLYVCAGVFCRLTSYRGSGFFFNFLSSLWLFNSNRAA